jgi:cell division protein FtsA
VVRNPIHATGVGLLLYGYENLTRQENEVPMGGGLKEVLARMRAWFQSHF